MSGCPNGLLLRLALSSGSMTPAKILAPYCIFSMLHLLAVLGLVIKVQPTLILVRPTRLQLALVPMKQRAKDDALSSEPHQTHHKL